MKRLARYLLEFPQAVIKYSAADDGRDHNIVDAYSDSDWAGCPKTRRSTTGGVLMVDGGLVKSWSSMQTTVAQSSGEAEYYAMVRAAAEALGLQSIMRDLGWDAGVRLWVDSSAAKSMSARIGLGKVRHMEVKFLWLQEAVRDKRVEVKKIHGTCNPADVLTKPKACHEVADLLGRVGVHIEARQTRQRHHASTGPNRDPHPCGGREPKPVEGPSIAELHKLPVTKPLKPKKMPDDTITATAPYAYHATTQRLTPQEAEARRRERVSMRECGPMQRGRRCAAESHVSWMPRSHAAGSDFGRTLGRSACAFAGIGSA